MIPPFEDPGEQTGSGVKRESQRCPETVDMFAEVEAKQRALDAHEDRKGSTLDALRAEMARICITEGRYVDANDARQVLESWGEETGPWMGALFRTKGWRNTGEVVKSTAVGSHARILWRYDLV